MTEHDERDTVSAPLEPASAQALAPHPDDGELGVGDDLAWPAQTAKTTLRLSRPTAILAALVLLSAGFWGGITLEKDDGSSTSSGFPGLAALRSAGAGGAGSARSAFGASSNATIGTVTDRIGNTLYVTSTSGSLVKVTLASSTSLTRNAKTTLSGLKVGDSVVVSGVKTGNGQMTASSISATAAGVSSGGGFASLFGGGGRGG
jgi:hypothetical protein